MMFTATIEKLKKIIGGRLLYGEPGSEVKGVSTDSRTLQPGMLFIALKGERYDGHNFITAAIQRGAAAVAGEYFSAELLAGRQQGPALLEVPDSLRALQDLAAYHRSEILQGPVIAVTGSSGKTTTKNLLAAVLAPAYRVLKNRGNYNNEIGLPLTLLDLEAGHQALVVEMAMRGRGQIRELCEIARPEIGVITNIGTAHQELLGSVANIAAAKGEMLQSLPADGLAVLNGDDEWCRRLALGCPCQVLFYGLHSKVDIGASDVVNLGLEGTAFTAVLAGQRYPARIPVPGLHNVYNTLAALAVGHYLGLEPAVMLKSIADWPFEDLRQELRPGPGGCLVFNDAYNANPESMQAALKTLAGLPGRKVAVLGDMYELGPETAELHRQIGRLAAELDLYRLITVGKLAREIAAGALAAAMPAERVFSCTDHYQATQYLEELGRGDVVLFKGSRLAAMEKVLAIWEGGAAND
ncbi:MAG: UDP-N-acetylmuramoyl-tripeptide--D-alanyl-D-alanine ligase [Clostridia bacterium]|nr:UDP-N-acetylmuramoyl-tripeptide--D-alanyl-D-alanine ligase [Clostridia bacterium]